MLWATRTVGFPQHGVQAALFVVAANSPDGGPVALHLKRQSLDALAVGDTQKESGTLDLKPGM